MKIILALVLFMIVALVALFMKGKFYVILIGLFVATALFNNRHSFLK